MLYEEMPLKTVSFIHPGNLKRTYQTVFQLCGKRYFASTAYRMDIVRHGWETMIFHTAQEVPDDPDDIDPNQVMDWRGIYREPLIYEPTQHAHEQIIRTWVKKQILQREGKVNG